MNRVAKLPWQDIKKAYEEGKTLREISEYAEISPQAVRMRLVKMGTKMRGRGGARWKNKEWTYEQIRNERRPEESINATATRIGVSWVVVKKAVEEARND